MNKQEFLAELKAGLAGLPQKDIEDQLNFYSEMIDDRMEEGFSEEKAVSTFGLIDEIVKNLIADTSLIKIAKERINSKTKFNIWEIILLVLGSPIWISILIAAVTVIFSLYISLWSVIVSFWSIFVSFIGASLGMIVGGIIILCKSDFFIGIAMIGVCFILAGLSIFTFYGCKLSTKGILLLTKKTAVCIKNALLKKETA